MSRTGPLRDDTGDAEGARPSVAPVVDPFVGRVLDGRYRVESLLGEGGLGTVYRAQHLKLARAVAIKVLREDLRAIPQIRARFEREVKALSSLTHPNVVTITDYGATDGSPYLVMELVEGRELAKMIGEPMPPARALAIIRQILASLAYAHERDVVHRDLKPANVIVRTLPDGRDHVVVLDFGLAKFVGDDSGADLTRSGLVVGTPAYMPPEQMAAGARKADARSDIYAAGLILFELLAQRRPFPFDEPADLLRAHLVMEPPTLAEAIPGATVHPALEAVLAQALKKTPDHRFASAKAMIDAIDALPATGVIRVDAGVAARIGTDATRPARPTPISAEAEAARSRARRDERVGKRGLVTKVAVAIGVGVIGAASIAWAAGAMLTPGPGDAPGLASAAAAAPSVTRATEATAPGSASPPSASPSASAAIAPSEPIAPSAEPIAPSTEPASLDPASPDPALAEAAAELEGVEPEAPFVAPPVVGPRPPARNPLRGRLPTPMSRVRTRLDHNRQVTQAELRSLTRYRNEHAQDPRARMMLGHAYMQRGWFSHALEQYERAAAIDASVRGNDDMLESLLRIARSETLATRAGDAIVRIYGREARTAVRRALDRTRDEGERSRLELLARRVDSL